MESVNSRALSLFSSNYLVLKNNRGLQHLVISIFLLSLISLSCSAQDVDQNGQVLNQNVQCNNSDATNFELDIESLLFNYTFTDNNTGGCSGNLSYAPGSFFLNNTYPFTCGDEADITFNVNCNGMLQVVSAFIPILDNASPTIVAAIPDQILSCDAANNLSDYDAWIASIINNPASYFQDDCTDPSNLIITQNSGFFNPDYPNCQNFSEAVNFLIEDECGNVQNATAFFAIEDTEPALINWDSSGIPPFDCQDFSGIQATVEAVLLGGTDDSCTGFPDLDDFTISPDLYDPDNWTTSADPCGGTYDFVVTYTDPCGVSVSGDVMIPIQDATGISLIQLTSPALYPNPVTDHLKIDTELDGLEYSVYNAQGERVAAEKLVDGINFSQYENGCYLVVVIHRKSRIQIVEKILKL